MKNHKNTAMTDWNLNIATPLIISGLAANYRSMDNPSRRMELFFEGRRQ
jgi:hypothetical protein